MTQQGPTLKETLLATEREAIQDAILAADGHLDTAAEALRISRRHLQRRARVLGVDLRALGVPARGRPAKV